MSALHLFAGNDHLLILDENSNLFGMGKNELGQISAALPKYVSKPVLLAKDVRDAAAGRDDSFFINHNQRVCSIRRGVLCQDIVDTEAIFASARSTLFRIKRSNGEIFSFMLNKDNCVLRKERGIYLPSNYKDCCDLVECSIEKQFPEKRKIICRYSFSRSHVPVKNTWIVLNENKGLYLVVDDGFHRMERKIAEGITDISVGLNIAAFFDENGVIHFGYPFELEEMALSIKRDEGMRKIIWNNR